MLRGEFGKNGKPIGELETNAEQFGYFDRLPESAQRALLEGAIEGGTDVKKTFETMLGAWSSGDVASIANNASLRVIGITPGSNNAWGDTYVIVQVQISEHQNVADVADY